MQSSIFDISIFGISIAPKWYGLMYALGFLICYQFVKKWQKLSTKELDNLLLFVFFGVLGGGRIGYVLFYNLEFYLKNPLQILSIWEGGMSFHGGLLGVILAVYIFSKIYKKSFFAITDTLAIIVPIAIGLGRIGNYINQELPGFAPYNGPFAIVKNGVSYFPSPLLEMFLEGGLLFIIMLTAGIRLGFFNGKKASKVYHREGMLSSIFLIGYSVMRIIAEQFRLPDGHIGYLLGTDWLTLGIVYTLPLFITGISILLIQKRN